MKSLKQALNETRPWGQEVGAEWDEGPEDDIAQRKIDRKERMAQWKRQKHYPMPGEQKPGFAKSPEGDLDEVAPPGFEKAVKAMKKDKSVDNPYAVAWSMKNKGDKPSDDMNESERCDECGMVKGHSDGCSHMVEFSNDMVGGNGMGLDEADDDEEGSNECPECGAPPGKPHDRGCPLHPDNDMDEADKLDDEDMDTLGDEVDADACPGCGARPGDGVNPKCDDPMGCGYWKELKASAEGPVGRSLRSMLGSPGEPGDDGVRGSYGEREGFETDSGEWIENPFWDESGRDEVDPDAHYGDAFKKSGLAKRLRWGESSDYDGLPLTEGSMFDRFDTLVGHRPDGTFDARENESTKLRALIQKVVRESWYTRDPETGEETEHSVDDEDLKDLYLDKDKKHESHVKEMKLSVAGPAFGTFNTDDKDDDDEDYKVLAPKKVPEPEKSGVQVKNKSKKSKS